MVLLVQWTIFLILSLSSRCSSKPQLPEYEWDEQAASWLKYHITPTTWDEARLRCQAEGAVLASPLNDEMKAAFLSFVRKQDTYDEHEVSIFTGVHAIFSRGDYSSIEGVPLLRMAIAWAMGEPDNYENSERCLAMNIEKGTMADMSCNGLLPFVCYKRDLNANKFDKTTGLDHDLDKDEGINTDDVGNSEGKEYRFDYEWSKQAGGWLKYHVIPWPWNQANERCEAEGATLSYRMDSTQKKAIVSYLRKQAVPDGITVFAGVKYHSGLLCSGMTYIENSVNVSCDNALPYVCYRKDDIPLSMRTCGTTDPGYVYRADTGSCYKFHPEKVIWEQAYMTCAAEGGYLAIMNDDTEVRIFRHILFNALVKYWDYGDEQLVAIGLYDWSKHGLNLSTIHGEPMEAIYHNWHPGQPDNKLLIDQTEDKGEYCGAIKEDGYLYDYPCHLKTAFLCEKDPLSLLQDFSIA